MFLLPMNEFVTSGLCFSSLMFGISAFLLLAIYKYQWKSDIISLFVWLASYVGAVLLTKWITNVSFIALIVPSALNLILVPALRKLIPIISLFGVFFLISLFTPSLFGLMWVFELIYTAGHVLSTLPMIALLILAIISIPLMIINTILGSWIVLTRFSEIYFRFPRKREGWKKANQAKGRPWVSIHIPCYAEPPEIVIETLNALSRLKYPNFEVIVLDNNTKDQKLWKPIQEHCLKLGERFRFFHVDELKGAKAGALNEALRLTSPEAEIIGVVDADFLTNPDFLEKLVGFFEDPKLGFVQTCQDYRDWEESRYLTSCYFEYEAPFKLEMPGRNEWDVNYTIGTMCLLRKKALEAAGGWAEWCLTEDAEIAVRIHALGYSGYYLRDSFGYGLIPETFEAYKQQRFRWSAGPSQQFQKHWRLYMPWSSTGLTSMQKMGETFHSLTIFFNESMNLLLNLPLLIFCLWSVISKQQSFLLPPIILLLIPISIGRNIIFNWIKIKLLGGRWVDSFYSSIASRSLIYTRNSAFIKAWVSKKLTWKKTEKFKAKPSLARAFSSSRAEIFCACIYIIAAIAIAPFASFLQPDFIFLIWLGILNQAITYLCAPLMAVLSEKDLNEKKILENSQLSAINKFYT